jgi:hypothetical protein
MTMPDSWLKYRWRLGVGVGQPGVQGHKSALDTAPHRKPINIIAPPTT